MQDNTYKKIKHYVCLLMGVSDVNIGLAASGPIGSLRGRLSDALPVWDKVIKGGSQSPGCGYITEERCQSFRVG